MTAGVRRSGRISWRTRSHPAYWAFLLHRVSGIGLSWSASWGKRIGDQFEWLCLAYCPTDSHDHPLK